MLIVSGADLVDGTPIYDVKPYLPFTDCHVDAVGGYADEHVGHKLIVDFPERLLNVIPDNKRDALIQTLSDDPRPSYQQDGKAYGMKFYKFNVKFAVNEKVLTVTDVEKVLD